VTVFDLGVKVMVCGVPANVIGDVRRVMMNPLKYIHLEGEGEALSAMILYRNGQWSAGRGQEEIFELMLESGMIDDWGPFFDAEKEAKQSLNSSDEDCITDPSHIDAYDQWVSAQEQDIYQPSYFSDYAGYPEPVFWCPEAGLFGQGSDESDCKMLSPLLKDDRGQLVKFTPEMLEQRNHLNWYFNFLWNKAAGEDGRPWCNWVRPGCEEMYIPEQYGEIELVSVGENHGVAKSPMGSVFVPRGVLRFLGSKAQVGQEFSASLEFVEGARYPWRVVKNSVHHIN